MAGQVTIELNDLRFFARHGVYEEEKKTGNEFIVNIAVSFLAPEEVIHSIHQTVNYVGVYGIVREEFEQSKALLETCAALIAKRIKEAHPFVTEISVHIKKISPPIVNFSGSVSVNYTRSFK